MRFGSQNVIISMAKSLTVIFHRNKSPMDGDKGRVNDEGGFERRRRRRRGGWVGVLSKAETPLSGIHQNHIITYLLVQGNAGKRTEEKEQD